MFVKAEANSLLWVLCALVGSCRRWQLESNQFIQVDLTRDAFGRFGIRGACGGRMAGKTFEGSVPAGVIECVWQSALRAGGDQLMILSGRGLLDFVEVADALRSSTAVTSPSVIAAAGASFRDVLATVGSDGRRASEATRTALPGAERLLLVEDDAAVSVCLARALRRAGYDVHVCAASERALEVWNGASGGFDMLITDVGLPGAMSGVDLAEALRRRSPRLAVVFMSGHDVDATCIEGAVLLQKPFAAGTLTAAVHDALAARSTSQRALTAC